MTTLPPLAILEFNRVCNCRGISRQNVADAISAGHNSSGEALYAAALERRQHDVIDGKGGFVTGAEGGEGYQCGTCASLFDEAAAKISRRMIIPLASDTVLQSRTGSCGHDCSKCAPAVQSSGCAPAAV